MPFNKINRIIKTDKPFLYGGCYENIKNRRLFFGSVFIALMGKFIAWKQR